MQQIVKKMKRILLLIPLVLMLFGCTSSDDDDEQLPDTPEPAIPGKPDYPRGPFDRTVLVYISGENNLNSYIPTELSEMRKGSRGIGNSALVVYVDNCSQQSLPYVLWIKEGETVDSMTLEEDPISSSPETMKYIMNYTSAYYPANEYGLVLWGHNSGWVKEDSVATVSSGKANVHAKRRGYGVDNGQNRQSATGKWMNISTLSQVLRQWHHLRFIMADCCQFQCIESAYELKDVTDYIIGSPAEVPGEGAPYDTVMEGLFEQSGTFYKTIADKYFDQISKSTDSLRTPLSVIYTKALPQLAKATNTVLHTFLPLPDNAYPDMNRLIYYRGNINNTQESLMYDMNDFILKYTMKKEQSTAADTTAYLEWKRAFDQAVIYKKNAKTGWLTNRQIRNTVFSYLSDERYGGVSMFVPQEREGTWYEPYTKSGSGNITIDFEGYNAEIKGTSWYGAAGLAEFGW